MKTTIHTILSSGKFYVEIRVKKTGRLIATHEMTAKDVKNMLKVTAQQLK